MERDPTGRQNTCDISTGILGNGRGSKNIEVPECGVCGVS
jgi:hypothetical protein